MPTKLLDDPGLDGTWGFQLELEIQERQGFLHLAVLLDTQIWRPQGDLIVYYNTLIFQNIFIKIYFLRET